MSQLYDDDEMKIKLEKAPFKQKNYNMCDICSHISAYSGLPL